MSVGDVAIIHKDNHKRGFWNFGTVVEVIPGQDSLMGCYCITCSGNKQITHLRHSVCHISIED